VLARRTALGIGVVVFGFALAAVNFLPFREYVAESPRGIARGYEYSTTWALAPVEVLGAAVPEHTGVFESYKGKNPFKLNTEYVGAFVLVMLALGFGFSWRNRHWWFFLGLGLVALTIVLGGNTPLYRLYYEFLPGTKRFRAPSLAFFLIALSLAAMAAVTLERIAQLQADKLSGRTQSGGTAHGNLLPFMLLGIAGAAILALVGAAVTGGYGGTPLAVAGFGRFTMVTVVLCLLMYLWWIGALPNRLFVVLLALTTALDLLIIDRKFFDTVEGPETMFARDDLITFVVSDTVPGRVWIVPSDDGQESNVFMLFGVQQAGGEHGNQLQRYNEYVGAGTKTYIDWHNFLQKSNFVNAANVRYLITRSDLKVTGADTLTLKERHRRGGWVYENLKALPRAYLVDSVIATSDTMAALKLLANDSLDPRKAAVIYTASNPGLPKTPLTGSAVVAQYTPDRVVIRTTANRRTLLVLADNFHKGWRATVNGRATPIIRTNHTFRGVIVEGGTSEVVFEFHPQSLYTGFFIYLFCLFLLLMYVGWLAVKRLRAPAPGIARV
jgi:hypothetical protein